jgi:adenylate cyclase
LLEQALTTLVLFLTRETAMTPKANPTPPLSDAGFELASRRAVILVVDLVESVRLMALDECGVVARWQAFLAHVQTCVLPLTSGRLVKSLGDGLMAEFSTAAQALAAATAMHQWMATQCAPLLGGSQLLLRAGMHASHVFDAGLDILGTGVNLAARVATLAEGGETVATVEVKDLLIDALDADAEDLGECHLKHIEQAVRVYRLGPAQQALSLPSQESYSALLLCASLAVIPFSDLCSTAASQGLGDMMADGVIGQLSQSPGLRVVSRLSSRCFRECEASLAEIAARLAVRYVVSGTYALAGAQVSITAELADATTGHVVWSGRSQGEWRDLFTVDSQLIHELADTVHRKILDTAAFQAIVRPLPTLNSYELFLGGIAMMHRANASEFETSQRLLESLTERHRRIALPHAWLGKWYVLQSTQGVSTDAARAAALALEHTHRALDLEPSSSLALAIEGFVYCHLKKDLSTADLRLQEACTVNPSEGFAWLFLAITRAFKGESAAALDAARRALALSPMDPLRHYYESFMGSCEFSAGHHEEAIKWCECSRRRNRQHVATLRVLIAANTALGRDVQAHALAMELCTLRPGYSVAAYEAHSVAVLYPFGQQIASAMRAAGIP